MSVWIKQSPKNTGAGAGGEFAWCSLLGQQSKKHRFLTWPVCEGTTGTCHHQYFRITDLSPPISCGDPLIVRSFIETSDRFGILGQHHNTVFASCGLVEYLWICSYFQVALGCSLFLEPNDRRIHTQSLQLN